MQRTVAASQALWKLEHGCFLQVPPLTYNPIPGRGRKNPVSQSQAMEELREVVTSLKPGGFEPKVVVDRPDYLHLEYTSPVLGECSLHFATGVISSRACLVILRHCHNRCLSAISVGM